MKFTIDQNSLSQVSSMVQRAASTKDTIPSLSGLLITANEDNSISFLSTDLEIGIKKKIDGAEILQTGSVLVNARYFTDFVRCLPSTSITMEHDIEVNKLKIQHGRSTGTLNVYDGEEFPELPLSKLKQICSVPQKVLKQSLKKTFFAAAVSHFKPVFSGILFDFSNGVLNIVASDTHRLAMIEKEVTMAEEWTGQLIVPARAIHELLRILDDTDDEIIIGSADNNIVFYNQEGSFHILSRLIEGQYPNYNQVVPKDFSNNYSINAVVFGEALERAMLMPTDSKSIKSVQLEFIKNELIISAYSERMGDIKEIIENITIEKEKDIKITFNTRYLLDIVKIIEDNNENVILKVTGAMSPALISDPTDEKYTYVLVPLRTG
ncbi:MAG: DNA polymerase III subunit beta [Chitinophagales bacterium]